MLFYISKYLHIELFCHPLQMRYIWVRLYENVFIMVPLSACRYRAASSRRRRHVNHAVIAHGYEAAPTDRLDRMHGFVDRALLSHGISVGVSPRGMYITATTKNVASSSVHRLAIDEGRWFGSVGGTRTCRSDNGNMES